ncbi:hypothetical protein [Pseudovibrio brasiliensis]|uniref:Uncharacterized protein n=1 Tax=Pseudovibrio brasiliensis TaxID=1898042 RepID=A0ABX8AI55_9HYPH|nr:hypothetical protein [Pseudovibrio brasiliensis]QUS54480.1 hypothetical protein KGB56_13880 [Pseudovibrio brasiliensis]
MKKLLRSALSYTILLCTLTLSVLIVLLSDSLHTKFESRVVYYSDGKFSYVRNQGVALKPAFDVKRYLLSRYPAAPRAAPDYFDDEQKLRHNNTIELKKAAYRAFFTGNLALAETAFKNLSWRGSPPFFASSVELSEEDYDYWLEDIAYHYAKYDVQQVVDALDTTFLLTAFLFDRMGRSEDAMHYYRQYANLLSFAETPFSGRSNFHLARRKSAVKARLFVLSRKFERPKEYDENSYYLTLVSMFVEETLDLPFFRKYVANGYGVTAAYSKGRIVLPSFDEGEQHDSEPGFEHSELDYKGLYTPKSYPAKFTPDNAVLKSGLLHDNVRLMLNLENCSALVGSSNLWTAAKCDHFVQRGRDLEEKVLTPFLEFKKYRYFLNGIAEEIKKLPWGEELDSERKEAILLRFETLEPVLRQFHEFLLDDLLFLTHNSLHRLGDEGAAVKMLCEVAKGDPRSSDYSHVAKLKVKAQGVTCR